MRRYLELVMILIVCDDEKVQKHHKYSTNTAYHPHLTIHT